MSRSRPKIPWRVALLGGALVAFGAAQEAPVPTPPGEGDSEEVVRYREAAAESDRPIDHYNLGTALLVEGRPGEAREPLQRALAGEDEGVRRYARYNYGLSAGLDGRHGAGDPSERRESLTAAREAFREALREDAADEDARWNLEVIERWLEEEERESGGEGSQGGESESPGGAGAASAPAGGEGQDRMLTPEEAAALLERAGEAEESIRDRVLGRERFRDPVVEKNW